MKTLLISILVIESINLFYNILAYMKGNQKHLEEKINDTMSYLRSFGFQTNLAKIIDIVIATDNASLRVKNAKLERENAELRKINEMINPESEI